MAHLTLSHCGWKTLFYKDKRRVYTLYRGNTDALPTKCKKFGKSDRVKAAQKRLQVFTNCQLQPSCQVKGRPWRFHTSMCKVWLGFLSPSCQPGSVRNESAARSCRTQRREEDESDGAAMLRVSETPPAIDLIPRWPPREGSPSTYTWEHEGFFNLFLTLSPTTSNKVTF